MRSVRAIEHADVCILMVDASSGFESQDQRIFHIADRNKKGIVILNKWDLKDKSTETATKVEEEIRKKIAPFSDVPILFISVLEKQRLLKGLELAIDVFKNRAQRISTSKLNDTILPLYKKFLLLLLRENILRLSIVRSYQHLHQLLLFLLIFLNTLKSHTKGILKTSLENLLIFQEFQFIFTLGEKINDYYA